MSMSTAPALYKKLSFDPLTDFEYTGQVVDVPMTLLARKDFPPTSFASTTHSMAQHPAWVNAYNAAKPADRYFKTEWKALLPQAAYHRSLPDSQRWFGPATSGYGPGVAGSGTLSCFWGIKSASRPIDTCASSS